MTERESEPTGAEVPVEDALEQRTEVTEQEPGRQSGDDNDEVLADSDPADRAEQGRLVDTGDAGDDEYPR
jgi:hypothetical protein